ncbi:MAG: hypothetical protein ACRD0U_15880 [Acidimicrobiales bacterium]
MTRAAAIGMLGVLVGAACRSGQPSPAQPRAGDAPAAPVPNGMVVCPSVPTVGGSSADQLGEALAGAEPADVIQLDDATYEGRFVATAKATAGQPIYLCGPTEAVLQADGPKGGYALHLDGASGWRLIGFSVRNAQKGVMADRATAT